MLAVIPYRMRLHDLLAAARASRPAYLETLQGLVEIESPTPDRVAVTRCLAWLEGRLQADDWTVARVPTQHTADVLLARADGARDGPSTLLLTHADTVWPVGTLAERPWRVHDECAFGPGVYDMKGGIAAALHAVALARVHGGLAGAVTLLVNGDEETGSVGSRGVIEREAARHDRVFVLEPASAGGAITVARKGAGDFRVRFRGRSAHSGEAFDAGVNAVSELARFVPFVDALSDREAGTTVAVTVVRGGTVSNVIPAEAVATVDLRLERPDEAERVVTALHAYVPHDRRVSVEVEGAVKRPPMVLDAAAAALVEQVLERARGLGLTVATGRSGGGSDANFCAALGVPTVDGLGPVGGGAHAVDEHIDVAASLDRVALLAALLGEASDTAR